MTDGEPETEDTDDEDAEGLTYAETGVDIDASEAATKALIGAAGEFEGDYAGLVDIGDQYLALATDGVGTKLLVAEAVDDYSTIGIDCIAMNANDLIATGVEPVAFVDYLAVETPDEETSEDIGAGLRTGAERAGVALVGGETAVMPDVIKGLDIAGTCAGLAPKDAVFPGEAEPGDAIVGWPSSGIHSNGLTLAREAVTRDHEYTDPFPPNPDRTIAEELLTPTRIYSEVLEPLRANETHAAAHVTGGGWTNLTRMGSHRYEITDPFEAQPVFEFVQAEGEVTDEEMHRTFNMGTGFVAAVPEADADEIVEKSEDARVIGTVADGDEAVAIHGLELTD
ncbi:phosphoribosylformylglycinamidine cyclo-ligase [Haloarcula hispanica]|uniref:phosphoribosylformylglycinamidine cyclo-ligase n=1 Tax=Haloarcula hispanica TaxID=51589 RepID=UPI0011B45EB0|nr:phosphoribosylformylglycinamidine cyclo-ligase [Haloarcula hispanica]